MYKIPRQCTSACIDFEEVCSIYVHPLNAFGYNKYPADFFVVTARMVTLGSFSVNRVHLHVKQNFD